MMPKALTDGDANYTSVFLTNLGSIGAGASYHHLNNYGTNSVFVIVGTMKKQLNENGELRTLRTEKASFGIRRLYIWLRLEKCYLLSRTICCNTDS